MNKIINITIESSAGAGKSCLAFAIADLLQQHGIKHTVQGCEDEIPGAMDASFRDRLKHVAASDSCEVKITTRQTPKPVNCYTRYTVVTHHTGCKIIEGDSCPVSDFTALLLAWAKAGEPGDEVVCDCDLPRILHAKSAVNVVAVVGRRSQLDDLLLQSRGERSFDFIARLRADFPDGPPPGVPVSQIVTEGRGDSATAP